MYDRAPRVVSQTVGSTADHVGPGTYDGFLGDQKKLRTGTVVNMQRTLYPRYSNIMLSRSYTRFEDL